MDQVNPLIPAGYDIVWTVVLVVVAVLTLAALVLIGLASRRTPLIVTVAWVIVVLAVPVVGTVAYLVYAFVPRRPGRAAGSTS